MSSLSDLGKSKSPIHDLIGDLDERPCKTIPFPKHEGVTLGLWVLTNTEQTTARGKAYKWVREVLKFNELDLAYDEQRALNEAIQCEVLAIALRDPERHADQWAPSAQAIRDRLNNPQIQWLWKEYLVAECEEVGFRDVENPGKEIDELVSLVGKGCPVSARLTYYATPALRELLLSAVDRLATPLSDSSSDSSSPSDSLPPSSGSSG